MDNLRPILWISVALMFWILYVTWQADYRPAAPQPGAPGVATETPLPAPDAALDLPALPDAGEAPDDALPVLAPPPVAEAAPAPIVRVRTDVLDLEIDLQGGDIRGARLPQYLLRKDAPGELVQLLNRDPAELFVFRTGLRNADGRAEPNHRARFHSEADEYALLPRADTLSVPLTWRSDDGITVTKTFRFRRGHYAVELEYLVLNESGEVWRGASYQQIQRLHRPVERSMFNVESYSFRGPVISDGRKYEKLKPDDLARETLTQSLAGGWIAAIEHHFLAAIVPPIDEVFSYEARAADGVFLLSAVGPISAIAPGTQERFTARLFVGPKLQAQLAEVAPKLPKTVDYGMLSLLAEPLFWLLQKVYSVVGNWGWSIIIVTFLIKLAFYKLTETSGRSMARMRKMQPRMKALQDRYKDDRQALSQALMDLYKREKINPAAGCLPMLVQIPFFIAFYWVLLESVEMRQAPFMLWISDLSTRDPWFVLPLCMGAAMYFQQKLNPAPPDPVQARIMNLLPVVFTVFFAFFPAGLVLYWFTNSLLSMLQQWRINKVLGAD